ncbi:class I tRNA ligase family protein [Blattabacterium cuenoti]|uniref:class I tRNA ligase family protein n=1 Tax=Blattabacterium cuenoti TaxID=1653831 RepID=UPI00293BF865|nr:class I tRNA ligase family protein [Blattabacterium cuenoti]
MIINSTTINMDYNFKNIEKRWQTFWTQHKIFCTEDNNNNNNNTYYILNMFPYPSGSGLHIGHCIGYIASDIYARYKRSKGYNVLNPIGFDSFGLPAEQYAIKTGQHPSYTTNKNINKYHDQINKLGISFDWDRKLCTSDPTFYRWTQWMFIQIFNSWYDKDKDKAKSIDCLVEKFNKNGNLIVNASTTYKNKFNSNEWKSYSALKKESILSYYRLAFLCKETVNWCPELGTVLANDEIINGKSQRGGYKIYKKKMLQWNIRITAYAERLLKGLKVIQCSDSLKKLQYSWIGKKYGLSLKLDLVFNKNNIKHIESVIFFPEMIFGITFIIMSTDHPLVDKISIGDYKSQILDYINQEISLEDKISGMFTGNYVIHPLINNKKIPIYVSHSFPVDNKYKSIVGIPGHERHSNQFANVFGLDIIKVLSNDDLKKQYDTPPCLINSGFLNGLKSKEAKEQVINFLVKKKTGAPIISYRLRDAVFSRQRYWGEPIPIYFKNNIPTPIPIHKLPLILPKIIKYHPKNGQSPLIRAEYWAWDEKNLKIVNQSLIDNKSVFPIEVHTMPSWAGSSWYFIRYMDVNNDNFFVDKKKEKIWKKVDLYIGGSEHATGHLIYSRFWNKFLKDRGWITSEEPFKKIINQGMILNYSAIIFKLIRKNIFISYGLINKINYSYLQEIYIDTNLVNLKYELDLKKFKTYHTEFENAKFFLENGVFFCKKKLEKMSKSKYNVINPDNICKKYGSDIFRLYEMFLGPIEKSKPWDASKINGVKNFLKRFWRLFHNENGILNINQETPTIQEQYILHETIKKVTKEIQLFSFNTSISYLMIIVNKLTKLQCKKQQILIPLIKMTAPFTPHIAEEIWNKLGNKKSIIFSSFPIFNPIFIKTTTITYPIMVNGKFKFKEQFDHNQKLYIIKRQILNNPKIKFMLQTKILKKIIIIPNKIINILFINQ